MKQVAEGGMMFVIKFGDADVGHSHQVLRVYDFLFRLSYRLLRNDIPCMWCHDC